MESFDREKIVYLAKNNAALKRLYNKHRIYEEKIEPLTTKRYLTASEELELKKLKREKLRGKDQMMHIVTHSAA